MGGVQNGDIGRSKLTSFHIHTKSILRNRKIIPEVKLRSDWTASAQQWVERPYGKCQSRLRYSDDGKPTPDARNYSWEGYHWETSMQIACHGSQKKNAV